MTARMVLRRRSKTFYGRYMQTTRGPQNFHHLGDCCFAGLALGGGPSGKGVEEGAGLQAGGGHLPRSGNWLRKRRKGFLPAGRTCSAITPSETQGNKACDATKKRSGKHRITGCLPGAAVFHRGKPLCHVTGTSVQLNTPEF